MCFFAVGVNNGWAANHRVTQMVVEGNQRVEPETIRSLLVTEPDGSFSEESLNKSLKKLFDSGYFADASLRIEGNTLIVTVVENPIVNQVAIEGNDEISDDVLKSELRLKPRQVFTQGRLKADVERLQTIYRLKGHFAAVVCPKIIRRDQNRVDVIFEINEGKATKVSRIFFVGNTQFSEGKLEEIIQTKESRWYRFFTTDDNYDPDRLAYDRELLRLFYLQHGYADFKVKSAVAELTPDKTEFFITFTLDEGCRYRVGKVKIVSKVPRLDTCDLERVISFSCGSWYNNKEVEKTIDALVNLLGQQGYAFVDVNPLLDKNEKDKTVDVTIEIKEGPRVYIDQIRIVGNVRTDEDVIRRELMFHEGDAFNSDKLKKSERKVRNLGFFKNVKFNREPSNYPDKVNIIIEVEEDRTGEFSLGGGFSTSDGILGDVRFAEHNFRGRGQDVGIGVTYAKRRQEFDISFTEPYFFGRDLAAGFDLYHISQNKYFNQTFDQKINGLTLRTAYYLAEDLTQQLAYTIRRDNITDVKSTASRFIQEQKGVTHLSEIAQTISYDRRDSHQSPTDGYLLGFKNYLAGLGGDVRYLKNTIFASYYYPLCDEWVLELSGTGNVMTGLGKDVRVVDRYILGGDSLRGFQVSGVSPRDRITKDPLGGLKSYVMTAELTFPLGLPNELGIKGAIFTDAGSVWDSSDPKNAVLESKAIRIGTGFGLRWRSPLGPLKIDIAQAIKKESFDKKQLVFFGVSTRL
jgi:outer membrane protein insertion porin family